MADNRTPDTADDDLAAEMAKLRQELANLKAAVAERKDAMLEGASRAAGAVAQPIRNHPGAAGMVFGGLVGILIGLAIGQSMQHRPHRWADRFW